MRLQPIKLHTITLENNVFLAPLAGYTNYGFRRLCKGFGAGLCFTEMVSAKGLKYGSENTAELLYTDNEEGITAAQIFGNEPKTMRLACENEKLSAFPIVDINMGCPVPKIYKNGEGSALLENPALAEEIVKECVKSGKIITVKFRIGVNENCIITEEFAKRMEGAGASLLTVHGRTRDKMYSGEVRFKEIERAKNAVKIPVIANGGVFSDEDAQTLMDRTGADGVMVARASLFNPQIFCELTGKEKIGKWELFQRQMEWTRKTQDDRFTCVFMRKMGAFYVKGERNAGAYKDAFFQAQTPEEVLAIAKEIWQGQCP